jgi:hypothetical protein
VTFEPEGVNIRLRAATAAVMLASTARIGPRSTTSSATIRRTRQRGMRSKRM